MKAKFTSLLMYLVISFVMTPAVQAGPIKVLHVSEVMQSEVQSLINAVGAGSLFEVTQMSYWDEYHYGPPDNLDEYDVIVFGLSDCLDIVRDLDELLWFVEDGGGLVFTHDSAASIAPPVVRSIVGVADWIPDSDWVWGDSAEIIQDHAVLHCLFEIGSIGDSLEIQPTHTVVTLESGDKILKLPGPDESDNWYLAAQEHGAGCVIVSQIGHSVYQCAGEPGEPPVLREQQLLVNCLYWVTGSLVDEVSVDIRPGACPNLFNVSSHGMLPVAIVGTGEFDVSAVDIASVRLLGVAPLRSSYENVATPFYPLLGKESEFDCTDDGPDGLLDLTLKFDTQAIVQALTHNFGHVSDDEAIALPLIGMLSDEYGGNAIRGEDVIVILKRGVKKRKGTVLREVWEGIEGVAVTDLTSHPDYPDNPSFSDTLDSFEAPIDWADNYGTRIRGTLCPQTSGNYRFWIASDDWSELWLSTSDKPANAEKIAWVGTYCFPRDWDSVQGGPPNPHQQSALISLKKGRKYYIMALQKEGTGGDNLAVAWEGPDCPVRDVIDGDYLSSVGLQ